NTDRLLGYDGFVGVKTGSDDAAGGCFAFRAIRWIDGKRTTITGVVLGQPGHDRIAAGLAAAETGSRPVSRPPPPWSTASQVSGLCDSPQPAPAPGAPPRMHSRQRTRVA